MSEIGEKCPSKFSTTSSNVSLGGRETVYTPKKRTVTMEQIKVGQL